MGHALDERTVAILQAQVVCGAANNQLAEPGVAKLLADRGILYAPDYVVNAGGLIQVADEIGGYSEERARARAGRVYDTTLRVLRLAAEEGVPPSVAADRLAERRMAEAHRGHGGATPPLLPALR
jgi:valine dehydrogenase (NAD+)